MSDIPEKLAEMVDDFSHITDRNERAEYLIEVADRFEAVRVPPEISARPHPEENHVQMCESDAYVWAVNQDDGTQKYYFDVLNPQGLSAMAISVILGETLSDQPLEKVAAVPTDIVLKIFGKEISMGKGQGLMGIVGMVAGAAKQEIK
ncbi:MAG: SufE family protein [bacterium]|nr:SufE family protein [bacterium]